MWRRIPNRGGPETRVEMVRQHNTTIDQIIKLQDSILKKLKNKEHLLAIFIDFERAFDMLHIPTLLRKLQKLGIIGNTAKWIESFLSDRTFQVKVEAELSTKFTQQNGTRQGSVISPLLFLIMINDIPSGPEGVDTSLFADDSAVYTVGRNIKHITSKIQQTITENEVNGDFVCLLLSFSSSVRLSYLKD